MGASVSVRLCCWRVLASDAYASVCVAYRAVVVCTLVGTITWICSSSDVDCACDKPWNTRRAKSPNLWRALMTMMPFICSCRNKKYSISKALLELGVLRALKFRVLRVFEVRCILCLHVRVLSVISSHADFVFGTWDRCGAFVLTAGRIPSAGRGTRLGVSLPDNHSSKSEP